MGATLPDGTLLLRALEPAVQHVAKENSQAAFRLAQSRAALQVDEQPQPHSIWDFSQCLLAEAEALVLMSSTVPTSADSPPLKLKVMEVEDNNYNKRSPMASSANGKGRGSPLSEVPCKWFRSDAGCQAGKLCKWSHSWDGVEDKSSRCWICGSKEHRKSDCKVKGGGGKRTDEPKGSGGGNARHATPLHGNKSAGTATSTSATVPSTATKINEMVSTSATSNAGAPGELKSGNPGTENAEMPKGFGDGGTGGDQAAKNEKTAELLHEATQLLKTLRGPVTSPMLKVMQLHGLERVEADWVLIDSGATHGSWPMARQRHSG